MKAPEEVVGAVGGATAATADKTTASESCDHPRQLYALSTRRTSEVEDVEEGKG